MKSADPVAGLYGARITGGGSGGAVPILGGCNASPAIARIAEQYERETGHQPHVFVGSSPAVAAVGAQVATV